MKIRKGKHLAGESGTRCQEEREPERSQAGAKRELQAPSADIDLSISDILDPLPFYVLLIDEDHYILQANRAVLAQLGLKPEGIVGKYCPQVIHGLDRPWDACPLEEAVEKGQAIEREALDQKSGRWIRSAIYPTGRYTPYGKRIFFHMVSDITDRKQAEEQLRVSREELRNLSAHLESVREEERTNMAREIHDLLGQILTVLNIDLSWLTKRLPKEQESLVQKAEAMHELLDTAIQTVKRISAELRPGVLDDLGLAAAIEWQGADFEKRTGIKFELTSNPDDIVLDKDRSTAIFRIFQETLTNVIRHASATGVKASLRKQAGKLVLTIRDNGKGITKEEISDPKAFGLIGMRERARFWGGEVKIEADHGRGTTVVVTVPLINGGG